MEPSKDVIFLSQRRRYFSHFIPLHKAALKGNWEAAEKLFSEDPSLLRARITEGGLTALHIASMEGNSYFVSKLLEKMEVSDMEIENYKGNTALCFAAAAGNVSIVNLMLQKNPSLAFAGGGPIRGDSDGGGGGDGGGGNGGGGDCFIITPLSMAALMGHRGVFQHLYDVSDFGSWDQRDKVSLLTRCISSGLYGQAKQIVEDHRYLAIAENDDKETPLEILARTPAVFSQHSSNIKRVFRETIDGITSPFRKKDTNRNKSDAYTLFERLWEYAVMYQEELIEDAVEMIVISPKLLFTAAEYGNDEFLVEIINRYPDFLYTTNRMSHSIFHIAVLQRNAQVFNLIYELKGIKDLTAAYVDRDGNNMLHLAAKRAPQERLDSIPGGAAPQMQQEVMWFKEVEKIVPPSYRTMTNSNNQTPRELFVLEHEEMTSQGDRMMKKTAKPFMLVAMLIPALAFATAVSLPSGYKIDNNSNNIHSVTRNSDTTTSLLMAFPISVAVSLFSSVVSMMMFLYIMTSRCTDRYFLVAPVYLVCGLVGLFISIGSMIVAFSTCPLFDHHVTRTLLTLLVVVAPPMLLALAPLPISVMRSTFSSHLLFGSNNRLFS